MTICHACSRLTSGDCRMHGPQHSPASIQPLSQPAPPQFRMTVDEGPSDEVSALTARVAALEAGLAKMALLMEIELQ